MAFSDRKERERSSQGKKVGDAVAGERSRRSRSSIRHVKSRPRWPRPLPMPEWMAAMATSIVWALPGQCDKSEERHRTFRVDGGSGFQSGTCRPCLLVSARMTCC
ncbi:hypothetical protein D3C87_1753020 [compost metagenome]